MKIYNHTTHNIAHHYLCTLINGDDTGLSNGDDRLLDDYINQFEGFYVIYHDKSDDVDFRRCAVSGLYADCYEVDILLQLTHDKDVVNYLPDLFFHGIKTTNTPRNKSVSGYGSKIPTQYMLNCSDGYDRRVYARCYGNAASLYIIVQGNEFYLHDYQLS